MQVKLANLLGRLKSLAFGDSDRRNLKVISILH